MEECVPRSDSGASPVRRRLLNQSAAGRSSGSRRPLSLRGVFVVIRGVRWSSSSRQQRHPIIVAADLRRPHGPLASRYWGRAPLSTEEARSVERLGRKRGSSGGQRVTKGSWCWGKRWVGHKRSSGQDVRYLVCFGQIRPS